MPYWKDVLGFFMVSVPVVWVGTLILGWLGKRLQAKPPYSSYEEFRKDVLGDVPIDEILERCDGRIPLQGSLVDRDAVYGALVQDLLRASSSNDPRATHFTPCAGTPYAGEAMGMGAAGGTGGDGGAWGGAGGQGRDNPPLRPATGLWTDRAEALNRFWSSSKL